MIAQVMTRIGARVPSLTGRVREGGDFVRMMAANSFRQAQGGAYVLPASLRAGPPVDAAGAFIQPLDEVVSVILVRPAEDPAAARAMGEIRTLIDQIIAALAGWRPDGAIGPLRVLQGAIINIGAGVLVYRLDFSITSQIRSALQ